MYSSVSNDFAMFSYQQLLFYFQPILLNNDTLLTVNTTTTPVPMTVGETVTFPLVLQLPAMSSSKVIVDASLPINGTSIANIKNMRLVSTGKNIKCLYENTTKSIAFTPIYNSTLDNCENNKGYIDLGIVTNAGIIYSFTLTYYRIWYIGNIGS